METQRVDLSERVVDQLEVQLKQDIHKLVKLYPDFDSGALLDFKESLKVVNEVGYLLRDQALELLIVK